MRRRSWTFWLCIGAVILIAFNLPAPVSRGLKNGSRDVLAPLQSLISSYTIRFKNAGEAIRGWGDLPAEKQRLEEELLLLQLQQQEMEELRRENLQLRRQLEFQSRSQRDLLAGEVLARDISGWWQTLRIQHKGSPRLRPDQAVISSDGLVGKLTEVSGRTADVLLLSDPGCRVAVQIEGKSAFGILQGQGLAWNGRVLCRMELINKLVKLERGDVVRSSGLGGIFPPGLKVGEVESVSMDENGLHQSAIIRPSADLGNLEVLFVVLDGEDSL